MTRWDPDAYARFKAFRDRPALELLLRLPETPAPGDIWDLGCGTGEHAALMSRRYPDARVYGLDRSADMLAKARARPEPVEWIEAGLEAFAPNAPVAVIFSNAAIQWVEGQAALLARWARHLAPGGVLAAQAPLSFDAPQHQILRDLAREPAWASQLGAITGVRRLDRPDVLYDALTAAGVEPDVWTTTYLQALTGEDPVVDWMLGTGLRPYVEALDDAARGEFLHEYRQRLARAFPRRADGVTLMPFERLFVVAERLSPR